MSLNAAAEQNEFTYYWCKKQCCEHTKWLLVLFVLSREWFILHSLWIWASIFSPSWPDLFACDITRVQQNRDYCPYYSRLCPTGPQPQNVYNKQNIDPISIFHPDLYICCLKNGLLFKSSFPIISCSMMEESFRKMFPSNIFYV